MESRNSMKVVLITAFILIPMYIQAGIQKGTYMFGGNMQLQNITFFEDDAGSTITELAFSPFYGYFFRRNTAAGPVFTYHYLNHDSFSEPDSEIGAGVFGRFYTGVNLFIEASVRYNRRSNFEGIIERGGFAGPGMGYSVMLGDKVAMEPRAFLDFGFGRWYSGQVVTGFTIGIIALLPSARQDEE